MEVVSKVNHMTGCGFMSFYWHIAFADDIHPITFVIVPLNGHTGHNMNYNAARLFYFIGFQTARDIESKLRSEARLKLFMLDPETQVIMSHNVSFDY